MDLTFRVTRRRLLLAVAATAVLTAGGAGYAAGTDSGPVISACMLKLTGTIRLYDPSAPANTLVSKPCNATLETPVSWNQHGLQGVPGKDGTNGRNGTDGINGKDGKAGTNGTNGVDGRDGAPGSGFQWRGDYQERVVYHPGDVVFSQGSSWITTEGIGSGDIAPPDSPWQLLASKGDAGTFTGTLHSPNNLYSLSLTNTGAQLSGPGGTVTVGPSSVDVVGASGGALHVTPGGTALQGTTLTLNGCSKPVARVGDAITGSATTALDSAIVMGSFDENQPRKPVAEWDGVYEANITNGVSFPIPILSTLADVTVPTIAAQVTVPIPSISASGSVVGVITGGSSTVCAG